jgi:integrase
LTDTKIRQAKPGPRPYRLFDGGGLWLEVRPSGEKLWRLKYRFQGTERRLALGQWLTIPLAEARRQRDAARAISDMALTGAYRRLGLDTRTQLVPHGWRATARTLIRERLGFSAEVIEHQLGHAVPDTLGHAYNRTQFLETRREMMQRWADYLDRLRAGQPAEVVPLRSGTE